MQNRAQSTAHAHEKDWDPTRQGVRPGAEDHGSIARKIYKKKNK
jgi:hypothetical protein